MDHATENLPLLPLTSGVLLPGMVFSMALESDEAKAAAAAARSGRWPVGDRPLHRGALRDGRRDRRGHGER